MAQRKKLGTNWGLSEDGHPFRRPVVVDYDGDLSKQWHVYYRYWDEKKGKLVKARKSSIKGHLNPNRSKIASVRYEELSLLRDIIERVLQLGWTPKTYFPVSRLREKPTREPEQEVSLPIIEAVEKGLSAKKTEVSDKYFNMLTWRTEVFKEFLISHKLDQLPAENIGRKHIVQYLQHVQETRGRNGKMASNKTRNGYLGDLSSVFNGMVEHEIIAFNPCLKIRKLKEKTGRHIPYTAKDVTLLSEWSRENSPQLYQYIRLIAFAFLRPKEILELRIGDIDLENRIIKLRKESAKVDAATIPIIEPLLVTLKEMIPSDASPGHYLFTLENTPGPKPIAQTRFFSRRFNKWKDHMNEKHNRGFSDDHTLYGIRHTFIQNIFHELRQKMTKTEAEFQLMTITRHRTIEALRKYTRDYGMDIANDWSDKYTLKF